MHIWLICYLSGFAVWFNQRFTKKKKKKANIFTFYKRNLNRKKRDDSKNKTEQNNLLSGEHESQMADAYAILTANKPSATKTQTKKRKKKEYVQKSGLIVPQLKTRKQHYNRRNVWWGLGHIGL